MRESLANKIERNETTMAHAALRLLCGEFLPDAMREAAAAFHL